MKGIALLLGHSPVEIAFEAGVELHGVGTLYLPVAQRSGDGPADAAAHEAVIQAVHLDRQGRRAGSKFEAFVAARLTTAMQKFPTVQLNAHLSLTLEFNWIARDRIGGRRERLTYPQGQ